MKANLMVLKALAVAAVITLASGCSLRPVEEEALKPPLVKPVKENFELYEVKRGTLVKQLNATASVISSSTENLYFKETGPRLESIEVKLGDTIKPGDLVATLDKGDLDSRIRIQELNVEKAKLALEQTKTEQLGNANAVRLKMIDVETAQISLDNLRDQLKRTKLISTIGGIVTYIDTIKTGDQVTAYKSVITVSDPTKVQLVYENSNTSDLAGIVVGMEVKVKLGDKEMKGKVLQTPASAPYTDNKTTQERNARTVIFGVDNLQQEAKIGSSASIVIETDKAENVIVIPRSGLRSYLGRDYVQVLEGESRKEIDVERGLQTSTEIEIRKGLKEGQKLILNN